MLRKSKPPVTEFLSTFCVVCPHSMTVERCVSTYNLLHAKHRQSASEDTLIDRLLIYWNGVATADYDPRPVVMQFLLKERRKKFPHIETYSIKAENEQPKKQKNEYVVFIMRLSQYFLISLFLQLLFVCS